MYVCVGVSMDGKGIQSSCSVLCFMALQTEQAQEETRVRYYVLIFILGELLVCMYILRTLHVFLHMVICM